MFQEAKSIFLLLVFALFSFFAPGAFAQSAPTGPDYSSLTSAVDWGTTSLAVLGIFAGVAVVYMIVRGAKLIMQAIKSA